MRTFCSACACGLALLLAGCAGYQLGPTNGMSAGARSVQINPIVNKTLEPRLGEYVMNSLRKRLQQDGTYRLDTKEEGDIIVNAVIAAYTRAGLSYVPTDVITPVDYDVIMTLRLSARERATGRVILDGRDVVSHLSLRAGNDLPSAERQALPVLTDDLAKKATALLVDGTW
jgi:Lipopolysaccharide-assembly